MQLGSIARKAGNWTHWGMLIGVVVAAVAVGSFATRAQGAEPAAAPAFKGTAAATVRTAVVSEGPIVAALSYTGDLKAGAQVSVLPKATGRIERLPVEVGSRVKKGDVIAELEAASMRIQANQARANLAAAEAKLAGIEAGSREEQIAQAQANLAAARARLAGIQQGGRGEQVAQAQAALDQARAKQTTVQKGATEADQRAAESAVDAARSNVQMARARLETVKQWPSQTEWGQALGALDAARANMIAAEARLKDLKAGPKEVDLRAAEAAVNQARAALYAANDRVDIWKGTGEDASKIATGATSTSQAVRMSEAAQMAYEAAQAKLDQLRSFPLLADLTAAQAAYDAARANVMAAEFRVDQMKRGAAKEDLEQAAAAVSAAEATLVSAEARMKQVKDGATEEELVMVEAGVAQAEQAVALAERPFRQEDLTQARAAVTVAEQQLSLALNPFTEHDLALVRANVEQARSAVEMAELVLSEAVIVSPMDGVVAERFQSVGALIGPGAPIASLVSDGVEMVLGVEESQIGQVAEGQRAEISVAAYPGVSFQAQVVNIAPVADLRSRTFQVKVRPEEGEGRLRQGMFAQVRIVTQDRAQAVLVPKEAVVARGGQNTVFVMSGDSVEARAVVLGMRHNGTIEVVSGLRPGEEVVVAGQAELRDGDRVNKA